MKEPTMLAFCETFTNNQPSTQNVNFISIKTDQVMF